jgi:nicotinamidase/pyrazinamidase
MRKFITIIALLIVGGLVAMAFTTSSTAGDKKIGEIVVDLQGDFTTFKKGSLAVDDTNEAFVNKVKSATKILSDKGYPIYGTQDWHPADHISFFSNHTGKKPFEMMDIDGRKQVLWPPHCVQGTENARVLVDNNLFLTIVKKGKDKVYDSYSGFKDDGGAKTEMSQILKRNNVTDLIVYGIATDYCVKATAIDAADAGFKVTVVEGLCKGVAPDTTKSALEEMKTAGITIINELGI